MSPSASLRIQRIVRQSILDGIELVIAYVLTDDSLEVCFRNHHPHCYLVGDDKAQRTTLQKFCLLQNFFSKTFAFNINSPLVSESDVA